MTINETREQRRIRLAKQHPAMSSVGLDRLVDSYDRDEHDHPSSGPMPADTLGRLLDSSQPTRHPVRDNRDLIAQVIRDHARTDHPIETCVTCGDEWENEADDFADHVAAAIDEALR